MTTIAFDGYQIVGDSQLTGGYINPKPAEKVFILQNGMLVGLTGYPWQWVVFMKYIEERYILCEGENIDKHTPQKPVLPKDNLDALTVRKGKEGRIIVERWDENLEPHEVGIPYAIGSGGMAAMGAMLAGKPAVGAVRIASALDVHTGGPLRAIDISGRIVNYPPFNERFSNYVIPTPD